MAPQFATWERGSHGKVTVCNDCHVPQDNFINKYLFKASDGLRHSFMFTFRLEPQVIQIKSAGKKAVQQNCIRCHLNVIHPVSLRAISAKQIIDVEDRYCWDCHRETPHGRVNSLSSTPFARIPVKTPIIPDWMKEIIENKD
jgi:cytochrome c nitrite reductase small subunit